jgi:hypothetical protein
VIAGVVCSSMTSPDACGAACDPVLVMPVSVGDADDKTARESAHRARRVAAGHRVATTIGA